MHACISSTVLKPNPCTFAKLVPSDVCFHISSIAFFAVSAIGPLACITTILNCGFVGWSNIALQIALFSLKYVIVLFLHLIVLSTKLCTKSLSKIFHFAILSPNLSDFPQSDEE